MTTVYKAVVVCRLFLNRYLSCKCDCFLWTLLWATAMDIVTGRGYQLFISSPSIHQRSDRITVLSFSSSYCAILQANKVIIVLKLIFVYVTILCSQIYICC